jgi:P-type Ca2+ transporter type 2C
MSEAGALARLEAEGFNELPRPDHRTPLRILFEVFREPVLALLVAGGVSYLLLGDSQEALILLVFASMSVLITVIQESRTERGLEALRDLTSPRALVIRDGIHRCILGREVARGDIVVLGEGDRVPADAVLLQAQDVSFKFNRRSVSELFGVMFQDHLAYRASACADHKTVPCRFHHFIGD